MTHPDPSGMEILEAYESGKLKSVATKAELDRLRAAATATAIKDRRVNIRLAEGEVDGLPKGTWSKSAGRRAPRSGA